jgi:phosphomannomutase
MLLEMLATTGQKLSRVIEQVQKEFGRSVYDRLDMHYPLEKRQKLIESLRSSPPADLLGSPIAEVKTFDGAKYVANDGSWLMFRASGTEPIIRIYSESTSSPRVQAMLEHGRKLALKIAG